ncbi:MAG: hypothetical protein LBG58_02505 [Planctomycetaceae bacterium]|nr:hypothetical protein [Planctomycetaceae bacterium]
MMYPQPTQSMECPKVMAGGNAAQCRDRMELPKNNESFLIHEFINSWQP